MNSKEKIKKLLNKKLIKLNSNELHELANQIRVFLIESNSVTGGHIGANLSVVELTIAIHKVFNIPKDKLIFDTGHQGYTHRILTNRIDQFDSLNKINGMNRFLSRFESKYDTIDASHAGTALSIASGIAFNSNTKGKNKKNIISIVGDGSLVEGMSFEALNFSSSQFTKYIIILNDNGMAIANNVGGIKFFTSKSETKKYSKNFFKSLNLNYLYISDGHNINKIISVLKKLKNNLKKTTVVHIKTKKGYGLEIAQKHKYKLHFSTPFKINDINSTSPTVAGRTYSSEISKYLEKKLKKNKKIVILTPGTPYASDLDSLISKFPDRVIDVGMAEQHIMGMACGLYLQGLIPIVCIQSTFMQRSYDQIMHDIAFMNLGVTIIAYRSGFSGFDSPTHHGLYDISYLSSIPNLEIKYPTDSNDIRDILDLRLRKPNKPLQILVPYEPIDNNEIFQCIENNKNYKKVYNGKDGSIICLGNQLLNSVSLRNKIFKTDRKSFAIVCVRTIKPLMLDKLMKKFKKDKLIISVEESSLNGGLGDKISSLLVNNAIKSRFIKFGITDKFASTGDKDYLMKKYNIDFNKIYKSIKQYL